MTRTQNLTQTNDLVQPALNSQDSSSRPPDRARGLGASSPDRLSDVAPGVAIPLRTNGKLRIDLMPACLR